VSGPGAAREGAAGRNFPRKGEERGVRYSLEGSVPMSPEDSASIMSDVRQAMLTLFETAIRFVS
jgi:hypothetical protein